MPQISTLQCWWEQHTQKVMLLVAMRTIVLLCALLCYIGLLCILLCYYAPCYYASYVVAMRIAVLHWGTMRIIVFLCFVLLCVLLCYYASCCYACYCFSMPLVTKHVIVLLCFFLLCVLLLCYYACYCVTITKNVKLIDIFVISMTF
jgi:hypothetical protein